MFRPKSSASTLAGRSTPLGGKDRKNLKQQFTAQFAHKTKEDFDLVCPPAGVLSVFSLKGVSCDVFVCDSVPIFITRSCKKKTATLIPTVFTLWLLPDLLPRLVCHEAAFNYISRGADFMIPGCVNRKAIEFFTNTGLYPEPLTSATAVLPRREPAPAPPAEPVDAAEEPLVPTDSAPTEPAADELPAEGSAPAVPPPQEPTTAAADELPAESEDAEASDDEPLATDEEVFRFPLTKLDEGQFWSLGCVGHKKPFAVGEIAMTYDEFLTAEKGKLLIVTHVVGDLLYKMCPSNKFTVPEIFRTLADPTLEALLATEASTEVTAPPPAPTPGKNAAVSTPLHQITAYQALNTAKDMFTHFLDESLKPLITQKELEEKFALLMSAAYQKSLEYPSLGDEAKSEAAAPPAPPPASLPPYVEILQTNNSLLNLCLTKKERQQLKTSADAAKSIDNQVVVQSFLAQGFKKLTILAPENATDLSTNTVIIEGDAAITISVKKTKRFIRTQVSNIHKFSNIDPKQLAERLQRACAASACVAEMEDLRGNPPGVLVQGTVPNECRQLINKTYGIPLSMIVIS